MKKRISILLLIVCMLSLVSCASPQKKIIGTWEGTESALGTTIDVEMTFNEDGTGKTVAFGIPIEFTYSFGEEETLTITVSALGIEAMIEEYTYEFDSGKLYLNSESITYELTKKD